MNSSGRKERRLPFWDHVEVLRRKLILTAASVLLLFAAGGFLAYRIIAPTALEFFVRLSRGDGIVPVWGMEHYIRLVTSLLLGVGLVFELPPVLLLLAGTGIVEFETLAKGRRIALVVGFVTGAVLTPPDIWTQVVVGIALYLLYEATLIIARIFTRRRTTDERLAERI